MWTLKLKLYLTFIWDWWIDFCHFPPKPGLSLADLAGQPMRGLIYWGKWLAFIFIYQIKGDCFNILQISGKLCTTWKLCLKLIIWHQLLSTQFNFSVYCKSGRWNFLYYKGIFFILWLLSTTDCPNSGLCCFDGCHNRCLEEEEEKKNEEKQEIPLTTYSALRFWKNAIYY